jgi:tRNA(Ile)-lysidine synthase
MAETLESKVLRTILHHCLFVPGDKVLVAVSGGPDSLCLLHLLSKLAGKLNITVQAVHVNHGLRPQAAREALYVRKIATGLGLPVSVYRADVQKLAREGGYSLQDAARRARYRCLRQAAAKSGARCIVTAHHEDDRVENLLLRLLGGSGLDGLAGLPVRRRLEENLLLARPLFHVSRREIAGYCRAHGLRPLLDRSNRETHYQRNRVRLLLLPWLKKEFGGHVRDALLRTCDLLAGESELLKHLATGQLERVILEKSAGKLRLDIAGLRQLPLPLRRRVVRLALWQAGVERPSAVHTQAVLHLADSRRPSGTNSLPAGFTAVREYGCLKIEQKASIDVPEPAGQALTLAVPGSTQLPWSSHTIRAEILPASSVRLPPVDRSEAYLDLERLELPLLVRTRCPGDRMRPLGAGGSRKLKKILIDKKVPLAERGRLPLVLSGERIAWAAGVEIADFCKVTAGTSQVLRLVLQEPNCKGRDK